MATPILMPQMGESIAEGSLVRWLKKVGDRVERDEPLFEISTDKVDAEIPSPAAGVLTAINVQEGESAAVHSVVGMIGESGEADEPVKAGPHIVPGSHIVPGKPADADSTWGPASAGSLEKSLTPDEARRLKSSPLVRRLAEEHHVDISQIAGSGLGGRVTKQDIERYIETKPTASLPRSSTLAAGDRVEKLSVMRRKIAEHMVLSLRTSAHVHSVFHVNFSAVESIRQARKTEYERQGVKLTSIGFIARAVVDAIRKYPVMNASLDGDNIVYTKNVNLGIAVALDSGLIVPVIRNADGMSVQDLSRAIANVAGRARTKKLNPEDVLEGTFTITNPGQFGAQFGMPIINQPQVAILGIGTIEKRPIVIDDEIAIRPMAYLTLGFDHRLIDGAVADQFMADVKHHIEHFDPNDE